MVRSAFTALLAASLLFSMASPARADVGHAEEQYDPGPALRRSGLATGLTFAAMFGGASGYPNEVEKIGRPAFEGRTGFAGGTGGAFWAGAALRDWLVVGLGASFGSVAGSGATISNGGAFVAHVEGFPLFYRGGAFQDLALVGEFGAGSRDIFRGSVEQSNGGMTSFAAVGLLWEPLRIGRHVSAGPVLLVAHQFSQNLTATLGTAGIQIAYYGGPG